MATLKEFVARHSLIFALLLTLATAVINLEHMVVARLWPGLAGQPMLWLLNEALLALLVIVLLTGLGWWRVAGFNGPAQWRALHVLWLPLLIALLPLAGILAGAIPLPNATVMASAALGTLLIGFEEEGRFRGLMMPALLPGGRMRAVLLAALFFGLGHVFNLFLGLDPGLVLAQIIMTTGSGVCFGAIWLRTGTIWPLILIHWLNDFLPALTTPQGTPLAPGQPPASELLVFFVVLGVIFAGYGLFLLRREWRASRAPAAAEPQTAA